MGFYDEIGGGKSSTPRNTARLPTAFNVAFLVLIRTLRYQINSSNFGQYHAITFMCINVCHVIFF